MFKTEKWGTFSSSQVYRLMTYPKSGIGWGVPAKKYIKQVGYELRLKRAISKEHNAKPTNYGTFLEKRVFDLLGLEYSLVSQDRLFHPQIPNYSGAPDLIKLNGKVADTVADVKCPYDLEVFCDKIEALKDVQGYKDEFPADYYQNVSNAILLNANGHNITHFEACIYIPYKSELEDIRKMADNFNGNQNAVAFLNWSSDAELPYINDNGYYKNLNIFRFPLIEEDMELVKSRVIEAGKYLTPHSAKAV